RRMAIFAAQPEGPDLFLRGAALFVVHLERPNLSPHALLRAKTGSGAAASETSTDPSAALLFGSQRDRRQAQLKIASHRLARLECRGDPWVLESSLRCTACTACSGNGSSVGVARTGSRAGKPWPCWSGSPGHGTPSGSASMRS